MSSKDLRIAFLGPSLPASAATGFRVLPPARQGDVWRALRDKPRVLVLIDGVFESQPSVWHHELLDALGAGVRVFGASSMGALRAAELAPFGMAGVGRVYRWVLDGTADDADVALLHADQGHGFLPLTVPQVTVRFAAEQATLARALTAREARDLVEQSAGVFYQERTWHSVLSRLKPGARLRWDRFAARGLPDVKALDALECLKLASRSRASAQPAGERSVRHSSLVRRRKLTDAEPPLLERLQMRSDAAELRDAGLRRALLAGWARELGLSAAIDAELASRLGARLAEEVALERLMLDHAARMLNDGPSGEEALADEARVRGLVPAAARAPARRR